MYRDEARTVYYYESQSTTNSPARITSLFLQRRSKRRQPSIQRSESWTSEIRFRHAPFVQDARARNPRRGCQSLNGLWSNDFLRSILLLDFSLSWPGRWFVFRRRSSLRPFRWFYAKTADRSNPVGWVKLIKLRLELKFGVQLSRSEPK